MAYIPPHKRNSRDKQKRPSPSPTPYVSDQLRVQRNFKQSFNLETRKDKGVLQDENRPPISKWFIVPSLEANHDDDPSSLPLKFIKCKRGNNFFLASDCHPPTERKDDQKQVEPIEQRSGQNPTILVCGYHPRKELDKPNIEVNGILNSFAKSPWMSIAEEIQPDLLASFQNLRSEMSCHGSELVKPSFVARFGINLLHGISLENIRRSSVKTALGQLSRSYITNFSNSFFGSVLDDVIPKIGVDFYAEKEYYYVKVFDKYRQHANITCKCSVNKANGELDLCKIELNQVRHLIVDISFLDMDLDPRLMLSTKRIFDSLHDDEKQCLRKLIQSAIIDSKVKGGLRWPLEMGSFSNRYSIIRVWHTKSKAYISSSMRLKMNWVDQFDFRTSFGKVTQELTLEMTEIDRKLRDATMKPGPVIGMVGDTLKLLWDHFLQVF